MSDAAFAAELIREVAGPRGPDEPKKALWFKAYKALHRLNSRWTERRVRALWAQEAARIEYREIREMQQAIENQRRINEARREHSDFLAETERLAALLAAQDEAFHSHSIEALRSLARGVDLSRTGRDSGD